MDYAEPDLAKLSDSAGMRMQPSHTKDAAGCALRADGSRSADEDQDGQHIEGARVAAEPAGE